MNDFTLDIRSAFRRVFRRKRGRADKATNSRLAGVSSALFGPHHILCRECRDLNISRLLREGATELKADRRLEPRRTEAVPTLVGFKRLPDQAELPVSCPFCRFLRTVLEDKRGPQGSSANISLGLFSYPYGFIEEQTKPLCSPNSLSGNMVAPDAAEVVYRIWVTFQRGSYPNYGMVNNPMRQRNFKLCDIQIVNGLGLEAPTQSQSAIRGRVIGDQVDKALLKRWIHCCDTQHAKSCITSRDLSKRGKLPLFGVRVIDLEKEQVVLMPSDCEYVTLSYVWGCIKQLCLTEDTLNELTTEGNLNLDHPELTRSAQDAMILCRQLGYRYLWIDALCIRQDEREELVHQCKNMDLIFQCASLTLVSAAGEDSNGGLPGVQKGSRKVSHRVCDIGDIRLASACDPTERALALSKWNSRGWTFQEKVLSSRMLIFTNQQVYWICRSASWCEDTIYEVSLGQEIRCYGIYDKINSVDQANNKDQPSPFEKYRQYLEEYSKRDFTYEKDTILAFTGALDSLHDGKVDSYCGLPSPYFAKALVWNVTGLAETDHRHDDFPSWSWAGWKGLKSINYGIVPPEYVASFWVLDECGIPVQIPQEGKPLAEAFGRKQLDVHFEDYLVRETHHHGRMLRFWASVHRLQAVKSAGGGPLGNRTSEEFNGFTLSAPRLWLHRTDAPFVSSTWEDWSFLAVSIWAGKDPLDPKTSWVRTIIVANTYSGFYIRVPENTPLISQEDWLHNCPEWKLITIV